MNSSFHFVKCNGSSCCQYAKRRGFPASSIGSFLHYWKIRKNSQQCPRFTLVWKRQFFKRVDMSFGINFHFDRLQHGKLLSLNQCSLCVVLACCKEGEGAIVIGLFDGKKRALKMIFGVILNMFAYNVNRLV